RSDPARLLAFTDHPLLPFSAASMLRVGQQCRSAAGDLRRRIGDERTAARVGRRREPGSGVLAEEREAGGMRSVADRERAAAAVGVRHITERRAGAEGNIAEVDRISGGEPGDRPAETLCLVELEYPRGAGDEIDSG